MALAGPAARESPSTPTVFEQQREELVREIAVGMEQVLQNINRLNRNLESIIAVGKEFSSVEALWSQFENFMGRPEDDEGEDNDNHHSNSKQKDTQSHDHDHDQGQDQSGSEIDIDVDVEGDEEGDTNMSTISERR